MRVRMLDCQKKKVLISIGDYFYADDYRSNERGLYLYKKAIIKPNKVIYSVFVNLKTREELIYENEYSCFKLLNLEKCDNDVYAIYTNKDNYDTVFLSRINDIKLFGRNNINDIRIVKVIKCNDESRLSLLKSKYQYKG